MKKLLFLVVLFCPIAANAQITPLFGCYMDKGSFPNCSFLNINCSTISSVNSLNYGFPVGRVCDQFAKAEADTQEMAGRLVEYVNTLKSCDAAFNAISNSYDSNEANRQEWIKYGQAQAALVQQYSAASAKQAALINKLRRACGTPCKRIK